MDTACLTNVFECSFEHSPFALGLRFLAKRFAISQQNHWPRPKIGFVFGEHFWAVNHRFIARVHVECEATTPQVSLSESRRRFNLREGGGSFAKARSRAVQLLLWRCHGPSGLISDPKSLALPCGSGRGLRWSRCPWRSCQLDRSRIAF